MKRSNVLTPAVPIGNHDQKTATESAGRITGSKTNRTRGLLSNQHCFHIANGEYHDSGAREPSMQGWREELFVGRRLDRRHDQCISRLL